MFPTNGTPVADGYGRPHKVAAHKGLARATAPAPVRCVCHCPLPLDTADVLKRCLWDADLWRLRVAPAACCVR